MILTEEANSRTCSDSFSEVLTFWSSPELHPNTPSHIEGAPKRPCRGFPDVSDLVERLVLVYFRSSLRAQTAKTLTSICTKSGVSADSRKSAKKCGKPPFCVKKCALFTQKVRFSALLALFLESAETPLFVQINVFAVWALRLDRKYTRLVSHLL